MLSFIYLNCFVRLSDTEQHRSALLLALAPAIYSKLTEQVVERRDTRRHEELSILNRGSGTGYGD